MTNSELERWIVMHGLDSGFFGSKVDRRVPAAVDPPALRKDASTHPRPVRHLSTLSEFRLQKSAFDIAPAAL